MAFLDNSGDIILDAVLTDTGRFRLARGNGNFRISKFALGDDEIDYTLYNSDHSSGSAYYDLEILQTPVLEAFTNNGSSMKSKLMTISRTNILFLPVLKLNESDALSEKVARHSVGGYLVAVDEDTEDQIGTVAGVMYGENLGNGTLIRIDQGIDNDFETSPSYPLSSDLVETQYEIKLDNRFGTIIDPVSLRAQTPSFIDDDNIATYFITLGAGASMVTTNTETNRAETKEVIRGPRGTSLRLMIQSSLDLNTSTFLFTKLGSTEAANDSSSGAMNLSIATRFIDTIMQVQGVTTGYRIDVPVRFVKKQ
tara:strand:+ start:1165 stop:2094 length:930 start_codon:yes stop_codon:yes gene_type:complete